MSARHERLVWLAGWACALAAAPGARAQSAWQTRLDISPFPSAYLSDWESNPTIGTLTITNPSGSDQNVVLAYRVTNQGGRTVASGRSDPMLIPAGPPTLITDFVNISGSSQHDQALEDQMRRTGRLPEGDNTTCVAVTDVGGFVLAEDCMTFSIVYPDPPALIGPLDEASLTGAHPIFQWTPLQVPPAFHLSYVLRVSEVLAGQTPAQALAANIPLFEITTGATSLEYPIGAQPLVEGKSYAWMVQALDQNGYAASSNGGRSDLWTFRYEGGGGGSERPATESAVYMSVFNNGADTQANAADAGSVPTGEVAGLEAICAGPWPPVRPSPAASPDIGIGVASPAGFIGARRMRALLRRSLAGASRVWSLTGTGPGGRLVFMAYGDCDGPGDGGRMHWIGVRSMAGASATWLMGQDAAEDRAAADSETDQTSLALEFGVVFFSLYGSTTAGGETAPAEVQEFLQGHEIEIEPGVTAYGVLHLREDRPYWQWARSHGFTERRVELFGFLGLSSSLSAGVTFGSDPAAGDVSMENKFLILRAGFPWRRPRADGFLACGDSPGRFCVDSSQLALEISFGDSLRASTQRGESGSHLRATFELWLKLIHTVRLHSGVTLTGMVALDFATEAEPGDDVDRKVDFVVSYGSDHELDLGQGWWIGHPNAEFHWTIGTWDQSLTLTGEFGRGDNAFVRGGITVSREWVLAADSATRAAEASARTASQTADTFEAGAAEARRILQRAEQELADARRVLPLVEGDVRLEVEGRIAQLVRQIPEYRRTYELAEERAQQARSTATSRGTIAHRTAGGAGRPSQWKYKWLARMAVGNMSLLDLVNIARTAGDR